ncbi:unnamed protein product, partial [Iphiclides podalirius]
MGCDFRAKAARARRLRTRDTAEESDAKRLAPIRANARDRDRIWCTRARDLWPGGGRKGVSAGGSYAGGIGRRGALKTFLLRGRAVIMWAGIDRCAVRAPERQK